MAQLGTYRIGGVLVGYYLVCLRKAWLMTRGIRMEQESVDVALGRLLDQNSYKRRSSKGIIVEVEAPDGTKLVGKIDGANLRYGILHEVKKGRSCEEAHFLQLRFYLWLLSLAGVTRKDGSQFTGQLDYPLLRRTERVTLADGDKRQLQRIVRSIEELRNQSSPPPRHPKRSFCRKCAYEELCYG